MPLNDQYLIKKGLQSLHTSAVKFHTQLILPKICKNYTLLNTNTQSDYDE